MTSVTGVLPGKGPCLFLIRYVLSGVSFRVKSLPLTLGAMSGVDPRFFVECSLPTHIKGNNGQKIILKSND